MGRDRIGTGRKTEIYISLAIFLKESSLIPASAAASRRDSKFFFTKLTNVL